MVRNKFSVLIMFFTFLLCGQVIAQKNAHQRCIYGENLNYRLKKQLKDNRASEQKLQYALNYNFKNTTPSVYFNTLKIALDYYLLQEQNQQAVLYGKKLIALAKQVGKNEELAGYYNSLSQPLNVLGDYETQFVYAKKAMYYAKKYHDTINLIVAHAQLGTFYWHIDELEMAIGQNEKAFQLSSFYPRFDRRAILLNNRATYYFATKKYNEALEILTKGLHFATTNYDSMLIYQGKGITYYLMDSIRLSQYYFEKFKNHQSDEVKQTMRGSYLYFSGLLAFKRNQQELSRRLLLEAIPELKKSSALEYLEEAHLKLYKIGQLRGDWKDALDHLKWSNLYRDSLERANNLTELMRKNYHQTLLQSEKEKALIQQKKVLSEKELLAEKAARNYSVIIMIISLLALIILLFWLRNYKKLQSYKQLVRERHFSSKMELKNKELATMKIQNIGRSNDILEIDDKLKHISKKIAEGKETELQEELNQELARITKMLQLSTEKEWEDFRFYFEQINDGFFFNLRSKHNSLTVHDEKVLAFIKVGMDTKQIARLLNVTQNTVRTQKYRLRKKMSLPQKTELRDYLNRISDNFNNPFA